MDPGTSRAAAIIRCHVHSPTAGDQLYRCARRGEYSVLLKMPPRLKAHVAEIPQQMVMVQGNEAFNSDACKEALVDQAFIVAGGEILTTARNWLRDVLDASQ